MKKGNVIAGIIATVVFLAVAYAGTTRFGNLLVKENLEVTGTTTLTGALASPLVPYTLDVTVSTPTAVGQLVQDASHILYMSTGTANVNQWQKVGTQN